MISNLNGQIATIKPFKVNLTDEANRASRTMGEGRDGLARLVSKIATININSLARENDPKELADRLNYDDQLEIFKLVIQYWMYLLHSVYSSIN